MDLSAYSMQKLTRERRERQPNWTEPEKQLLVKLTMMYQPILGIKGGDTITLKRKSKAWDEITMHMAAAGYNRSKERLKQQLGRMRAAEAKNTKDAMDINLTTMEQDTGTQQNTKMVDQMHFMLHNIQTKNEKSVLNKSNKSIETNNNTIIEEPPNNIEKIISVNTPTTVANTSSKTTTSASSRNIQKQRKYRIRRMRLTGIRIPPTRELRSRQIHLFQLAVERKRLRSLDIQQKRDRILYRKDVQIQNLKLQILRNIANQNREGNSINL